MSVLAHFLKWNLSLAEGETQTTPAERDCLAKHAAGRECLAEIGVWHGVTTVRLRAAMSPSAVLYAIDPFPPGRLGFSMQRRIARGEVRSIRNGRIEWLRTTGFEAARTLAPLVGGKLEFLFIDGDHSYDGLKGDWEGWSGLIAPRGVVALHDSRPTPTRPIDSAGSARYTAEVVLADHRFRVVDTVDSLTVVERIEATPVSQCDS